jgi:hypothetical protein
MLGRLVASSWARVAGGSVDGREGGRGKKGFGPPNSSQGPSSSTAPTTTYSAGPGPFSTYYGRVTHCMHGLTCKFWVALWLLHGHACGQGGC